MRRSILLLAVFIVALDARAQSQYDGTWNGTTGQGRAISLEVSGGSIRKLVLSARVEAVGCSGGVTETINTVVSIGNAGNFSYQSGPGTPTTWTINGTFSTTSPASGSLSARVNFAPIPGICQGSANTTWTATKSGGPDPGPGPGPSPGGTWKPQTSGVTASLGGIDFADTAGIASGGTATILRTTNGGESWSRVSVSVASDRCCYNARFSSPSVVWVVGIRAVLRSTNAGQSFGSVQYTDSPFRTSIFPISDTVAWAVGGDSGQRIHYRYTMSGSSISSQFWSVPSQDFMRDIFFIDANTGWSVGSPGRIIKITNATGEPFFSIQQSGTSVMLHGVFFLDANTGWTVGDGGTILKTTNGGASWSPQFSGTTNNLQKVAFRDPMNGLVVGASGTILSTNDGGTTWTPETSGTSNDLRHIEQTETSIYVVGQSGTILQKGNALKRRRASKRGP